MIVTIQRNQHTRHGTDGCLYIDGSYTCDTAEKPYHHLPAGYYKVTLKHHPSLHRKVPVLTPLENLKPSGTQKAVETLKPSAPQGALAFGNGLCNISDCCIHVGEFRVSGLVIRSYDTFLFLYDRINNTLRKGKKVLLIIKKQPHANH